ncbi:MAG: 3'-5' exonuclease [Desulfuromonadales bacterium]
MGNYSVVVLDFETTGLSPDSGDRVIEVGAVLIENNRITDRFQSLMNPGMRVDSFIESYTGITNGMLQNAPPVAEVMETFATFLADHPLVAHNAAFDRRFLDAELQRVRKRRVGDFACSMLISRRVYPEAPNHRLESLVQHKQIKSTGAFHRALADAEMTGHLWVGMIEDLKDAYQIRSVPFELMLRLAKVGKRAVPKFLQKFAVDGG